MAATTEKHEETNWKIQVTFLQKRHPENSRKTYNYQSATPQSQGSNNLIQQMTLQQLIFALIR